MNRYQAIRHAGPLYAEQVRARFPIAKRIARPPIAKVERQVGDRIVAGKLEELDGALRATVGVRHPWRRHEYDHLSWLSAELRRAAEELARALVVDAGGEPGEPRWWGSFVVVEGSRPAAR